MDVVSMQLANKALKRLNTEYNGFCYNLTATEGQTDFTIEREFDKEGYSLKVYVEGIRATKFRDYEIVDSKTVRFKKPLVEGDIVTLTTDVAGVPKYIVDYDDTEIKEEVGRVKTSITEIESSITNLISSIEDANNEINVVKNCLDDDKDGSIIDTIENIKAQWESADEDLKTLINGKCSITQLDELKSALDEYKVSIQNNIDTLTTNVEDKVSNEKFDTLSKKVTDIEGSLNNVINNISSFESLISELKKANEELSNDITGIEGTIDEVKKDVEAINNKTETELNIVDQYTGRKNTITLSNGTLVPTLNHTILAINDTMVDTIETTDVTEFNVNVIANDDTGIISNVKVTVPEGVILEYLNGDAYVEVTDTLKDNINLSDLLCEFKVTASTPGEKTITISVVKSDVNYELGNHEITFNVIEKAVEPDTSEENVGE